MKLTVQRMATLMDFLLHIFDLGVSSCVVMMLSVRDDV
jgi:hypothetical protein